MPDVDVPPCRPSVPQEAINPILEIHKANPLWSPERIHQQLILLNVTDPPSPNTIRKYLKLKKPPSSHGKRQAWYTFYQDHAEEIWGVDFFTVPTLSFRILYVLVIIHHGTRRIVHTAVTDSPNQFWLTQQFRIATPYDRAPKYIVHDNDPVFKSRNFKKLLDDSGVKGITTGKEAPWQNPYAERVIGTIRRELLDYVVPLNELHLDKLLKEYVNAYYNPHRTHHGLRGDTPIPHRQYLPTDVAETTLRKTRILGGLYHTLEKVG